MIFQHVGLEEQRLVESAVSDSSTIKFYCGHLLAGLNKFFDLPHNQANYAVKFSSDEQLRSTIATPFGNARGRLVVQIVGTVIVGRYIFEKSVASELGQEVWLPIWAIRITKNGNVLLGDEGDVEISVESTGPFSNAISAPAKSLLYSIGITPAFKP